MFDERIYCENIVSKYATYLAYYFGMSSTFSLDNVHYMIKLYLCFPIYYDELNKLTFEHYRLLVNISDISKRYFYFRVALFCRSSVAELNNLILNDIYLYM